MKIYIGNLNKKDRETLRYKTNILNETGKIRTSVVYHGTFHPEWGLFISHEEGQDGHGNKTWKLVYQEIDEFIVVNDLENLAEIMKLLTDCLMEYDSENERLELNDCSMYM